MTTSRQVQDSEETPAARRVRKANVFLREELGIRTKIDLEGNRLRIRKTLPPRPRSGHTEWYQQTISLGLEANQKGVEQATLDIIALNNLLSQRRFDWKEWDLYINRSYQHRVKQTELIGAQVEKFKKYFLALPAGRLNREEAWKTQWLKYLNKLPWDQYLTDQIILDAISQKTKEASSVRERFCFNLKSFLKFLNFDTKLDLIALSKGYELPPVNGDELPTDLEILEALDLINETEWQIAYLLQAVFGLRNHEIFFLNRSKIELYERIYVLKVGDETKTGFHPVAALYPEWFADPKWQLQIAKLPEVELDLKKTTLGKIGRTVTDAFTRFKIPFSPYKLRHAWARRALEFGFTDETAAGFMGHSVEIHRKHYQRLIATMYGLRITQSYMNNPDRPKPPLR